MRNSSRTFSKKRWHGCKQHHTHIEYYNKKTKKIVLLLFHDFYKFAIINKNSFSFKLEL